MNDLGDYKVQYDYRQTLLNYFTNCGIKLAFKNKSLIEFEHKKLSYVYLITKGRVKQYFIDSEGIERTILILSTGDMFGEITLFQNDYDMVITETLEDTELIKISKDCFLRSLNSNTEICNSLFKLITTKFRILMAEIHDMSFYSTKDRLLTFLNRISIQNGIKLDCGIRINLRLTHQDIATMIGSTRSTVTKLLKEMQDLGIIKIDGKYIILIKK